MEAGQIYRDHQFYCDIESGELLPKLFVVLAFDQAGDVIARLLTSRQNARPQNPRCFHGLPYPGFFVGVLCHDIPKPSWLDLRALEEFDRTKLNERLSSGLVELVFTMPQDMLLEALDCAARADDTTIRQERFMRDQLSRLRSRP